jgi:cytidylate kinase
VSERAARRHAQLIAKGESVSLPRLLEDIEERDARDRSREVSPLAPAEDAIVIDSSASPITDVFERVMHEAKSKGFS